MIKFFTATKADIPVIQDLAEQTWWPTYGPIQPREKIEFLLKMFYSKDALSAAMDDGTQEFILALDDDQAVGFASYGERADVQGIFKLHKLYVLPATHGKGTGAGLVDEVKQRVRRRTPSGSGCVIDLNVYRGNPARGFYEKLGFRIIAEVNEPVGKFFFEDYLMRMEF